MNNPHQQGTSNSDHPDSLSLLQQGYHSMVQAHNSQGQANPHIQFLAVPPISSGRLALQPQGMNQNCNAGDITPASSAAYQQVLINNNLMRMALAGNLNLTNVLQIMNMSQTLAHGANRVNDNVGGQLFPNEVGPTNVTNSGRWNNGGKTIQASSDNSNKTNLPNPIANSVDLSSISLSNAATFYRQLQQQTGAGFGISTVSFQQPEQPPAANHAPTASRASVISEANPATPSKAATPLVEEEDRKTRSNETKNNLPEIEQHHDSSAGTEICIEAKKGARVSVVPCRARGMSVKHNFQTAFFEISESVKHGDPLICSYPDCRNRGVKFLYCSYCKDPVAKRNFRNRHNHGMAEVTEAAEEDENHNTAKAPAKVTSGSSSSDGSSAGDNSGNNQDDGNNKRTATQALGEEPSADLAIPNKLARLTRVDPTRVEAWQMLLPTRPSSDDEETMSAWLMRVMAVSDTARPISEVLANLELVPPRGQKKPYTVPVATSETEEDTNEESNDTTSGNVDGGSSSSPRERAHFSNSNDDSNDSNESSSENGHQDANTGYSSETQDPMGSSPTEGSSSDDSNDSSSSENRDSRKYSSLSGGSHKYTSQESEESLPDNSKSK